MQMTNTEYHSRSEISSSDLKAMKGGNTAKVYERIAGVTPKKEPSAPMILGSAVHKLVLEPYDFESEFAVEPSVDKRTKEGKAIIAEFAEKSAGKMILSANDYERAINCANAILNDTTAKELLSGGEAEQSYFMNIEGVACRVRPDYFNPCTGKIIDIKTTSGGVGRLEFAKEASNRQYYLQASFYFDGLKNAGFEPTEFIFIVVNTTTFNVGFSYILPPDLETGRALYQARLNLWKNDVKNGNYYTDAVERREDGKIGAIQRLPMPSYAIYEAEAEINEINAFLNAREGL